MRNMLLNNISVQTVSATEDDEADVGYAEKTIQSVQINKKRKYEVYNYLITGARVM